MSTLTRIPAPVKPTRKSRRPAGPFGVGLIDPEPAIAPRPLAVDVCPVPTIRGEGLSLDEYFRVNGARNRARSIYAQDAPGASPGELDRVADAAATDALRAVLRDRTAVLAAPEAVCCQAGEPQPCAACLTTAPAIDPGDVESDPSEWPAWTDEVWTTTSEPETLTVPLAEFIAIQADRYRMAGTRAGDLLGRTLERLAHVARFTGAKTPHQLEARMEVLEQDDHEPVPDRPEELMPSGQWA